MAVRRVALWQRPPSPLIERVKACQRCGMGTVASQLYIVRHLLVCELCGKEEIAAWNNAVTKGAECGGSSNNGTIR